MVPFDVFTSVRTSREFWHRSAVLVLLAGAVGLGVVGVYALATAPTLPLRARSTPFLAETTIDSIAGIPLEATFFRRLPEFFAPAAETHWWQQHARVYETLVSHDVVRVVWHDRDGPPKQAQLAVGFLSGLNILMRTWLIYLVAGLYCLTALLVFQRHRSPPGIVLTYFLFACALYFVCSAPVVSRSVTLRPGLFRLLTTALYIAAGGLITLAHFAVLFPRPKALVQRYPESLAVLYGYFGLTVLLYLTGITAFGTTLPVFCLWIAVIIGAFLHSLLTEPDPFLQQQIRLSVMAPVFAGLFAVFYLLPGVLRLPPVPLTYFALFSLIIPAALPLSLDNYVLYHARLAAEQQQRAAEQQQRAAEQQTQQEIERFRRYLHDLLLTNLASIDKVADATLAHLDSDRASVSERLQTIRGLTTEPAQGLRGFIGALDEQYQTWEAFCAYLRQWGQQLAESLDLTVDYEVSSALLGLPSPPRHLRVGLYLIYREALINVIKHAYAKHIHILLTCCEEAVVCVIQDDGVGFDPAQGASGHYGLRHIRQQVHELEGTVMLTSSPDQGTHLMIRIPWREKYRN
jgi:signal transduction histidine kinase